jgi:hypothetical protein
MREKELRAEMLYKGTIRPNLKNWNRDTYSKADMEKDIK